MINWFKRKMGLLSFAMAKVEQNSLGQTGDALGNTDSTSQTYHQGILSDSLLKGEITLEVQELRWRLYKVLSESKNRSSIITGYDKDNLPIVTTTVLDRYALDKVLRDDADAFDVEMVVSNEDITKSTLETLKSNNYDKEKTESFNIIGNDSVGSDTLGEISFSDMVNLFKDKKTLYVERELRPKFELEKYAEKLIVRNVTESTKLLEFYVSSYADEYNRKSRLLIPEIKRAMKNPKFSDLLDIKKVGFISDKTIGVVDGLEFEYKILTFHKIVEFNGSYVIKFLGEATINGENIFEKYKLDDLEERYKNKEAK